MSESGGSGGVEVAVPIGLRSNVVGVSGAAGEAWLAGLAAHLSAIEARWRIKIGPAYPGLSFNYVAHAVDAAGRPAVLKTGMPGAELIREMAALRRHGRRGSVRLIRSSRRMGAMLLERIQPGTTLAEVVDDEAATRIAAECMRALWVPLPAVHTFVPVERWAQGLGKLRRRFGGGTGPLPVAAVERAEGLFADLLTSTRETVLLHGDLHHYNVLRDGEGWRAIDPKGVAGDPAYECGAWMRNLPGAPNRPDMARLLDRRIAIFSEMLGFDRQRIRDWSYAQGVLSAWWCIEDGGDCWEGALALAGCL